VSGVTVSEPDVVAAERRARRRYRKAGWALLGAVAVLVAAAVVSDLPVSATAAARQADLRTFVGTIEGDIGQCSGGLGDAVTARQEELVGKVAHSTVTTFITQAIAVCSFTDAGVVDLGGLQPPRSLVSLHLDALAPDADAWAYLYAFTTLQDLKVVETHPGPAATASYRHEVAGLDRQRAAIDALVARADRRLGVRVSLPLAYVPPRS
jgi:hypothetical protein